MSNVHNDCEHYVKQNDMCLLFFELGYHNVSKNYPNDCVDHFAFAEDEDAYREVINNG